MAMKIVVLAGWLLGALVVIAIIYGTISEFFAIRRIKHDRIVERHREEWRDRQAVPGSEL